MKYSLASYVRSMAVIAGLVDHAKKELELAGLFDKDSDYDGMIGKAVMELCKCFSGQGHSGFSAGIVLDLFRRLGKYEQLTPVTDNPKDWNDISEMGGKGDPKMWQSKRNPALFSENGGKSYYDVDDKKRLKTRSKKYKKKASNKPSIFQRTTYRLPTKDELVEVDSFNLSPKEILNGFYYTIVGRGILRQKEKDTIIKSIELLNKMFPGNYEKALSSAKAISLFKK